MIVPANSVPAAAVIRGGLALFGMIGRKGSVGSFLSQFYNFVGLTRKVNWDFKELRVWEGIVEFLV